MIHLFDYFREDFTYNTDYMNVIMDENQQVFETMVVNEIGENEPASKNSQTEPPCTSTCDTNNITEITNNMNYITIKEISNKDEIIKILKGQRRK